MGKKYVTVLYISMSFITDKVEHKVSILCFFVIYIYSL